MQHKKRHGARLWLILGTLLFSLLGSACSAGGLSAGGSGESAGKLAIVAAENFYGDLARQLGGDRVSVTSILSDPNIDPHEYESNVQNAAAVAEARLVIANGGGYDSWIDRLLAAAPQEGRIVLKGYDLAPVKLEDNEHIWYSPTDMAAIARAITQALQKLDPAHASGYNQNLQRFLSSLEQINSKLAEIKARYSGTPVGLTETLFLYQSTLMGLKVLTPFDFQKAIAEGNDPPASSVVTVESQIQQQRIKVLIYNEQTATAITSKLRSEAQAHHIPLVAVSETMPPGKSYQTWMLEQLNALESALQSAQTA
ncbi:metal ABC transporter solute-binding protein, Zn/Mn family [Thermogemmatispora sp.]|uniref:metal ABC transporter solute-binding protein, Zn/Mn family n=1 Tax=Thermogemmatispora sp. TaxID=1968838 RepID=UPI0035E44AA0